MKKDKKVFIYGLIMLLCVALIGVIVFLSEYKIDRSKESYSNKIEEKQNSIRSLEEENEQLKKDKSALEAEVSVLKNEKAELETKLEQAMLLESDITTMGQAMNDLKEIYDTYKSGNKEEAKEAFEKIEPMGFDDATLAYYELLKDVLQK